jgi:ribosomal protein S18 acetylase RimI-like enzyme
MKEVARDHPYTAHFAHPAYCNRQRFQRGENIVAQDGVQILGFASLRFKKRVPETEIDIIGVLSSCRSRGLGKAMLEYVKRVSEYPRVTLNVMKDNAGAIAFYEREGFKPLGDAMDGQAIRMVLEWQRYKK